MLESGFYCKKLRQFMKVALFFVETFFPSFVEKSLDLLI